MTNPIRIGSASIVSLLVAMQLVLAPVARAADEPAIEQVGFVPSAFAEARRFVDIDAGARRLLEIGQRGSGPGMFVVARDLDSLDEVGRVRVNDAQSAFGGWLSVVDELRHRLYVVYPTRPVEDDQLRGVIGEGRGRIYDEVVKVFFGVAVVDTLRLEVLGSATLAAMQPAVGHDRTASNTIGIKSIGFHREGGRDLLYLTSELPIGLGNLSVSDHAVFLHQIDVETLLDPLGGSAVDWSHPVPECAATMARDVPGVIFRSAFAGTIAVACRQGGILGVGNQPLETPGVVLVVLGPDGDEAPGGFVNRFYPVSGNLQYGIIAVDPVAERLFIQIDGSGTEAGVWVFDVPTASWVGLTILPPRFGTGGTGGLAIDPRYGRFYAVSLLDAQTGTATAATGSTRASGADQGSLEPITPLPEPARGRTVVDPFERRIYQKAAGGYIILEDRAPPPTRARPEDPDASTVDVAESARTDVNFVGGAQAFGARIRWVGGSRGLERNANQVWENRPSELSPNTGGILPPPPTEGTRDLHLARVVHTTLSNGEASARASGAERDLENTDADAGNWTNYVRRWGGPDFTEERWPYPTVDCADFGGAEDKRHQEGPGAVVTCARQGTRVTGVAVDESFSRGEVLHYAQARARSLVIRDPERGVVSIAESEMIGLELRAALPGPDGAEVLTAVGGIGRVRTYAETWATGRRAASNGIGAGSRFIREIEDVWVLDEDGARVSVCRSLAEQRAIGQSCDPQPFADGLNRVLGLRARVDVPDPEPARAAGTPGGFEALIVRDPLERANEASVNEEADARRLEVPGLVLTLYADGRVPSRVVMSLAGVSAESHYGIFLLSQAVPFDPPPSIGRVDRPTVFPQDPLPSFDDVPPPDGGGPVRLLRKTLEGIRLTLASPVRALRVAGLWGFLAGPLVLWIRRRASLPPIGG